jgi:hypothetical protein
MALPDGAHYVPGTGRRTVQLSNGDIISRQTAENLSAQTRGFNSDYERRQAYRLSKQAPGYDADLSRARAHGTSRQDFDNARARMLADYERAKKSGRPQDKSVDGPLDKYLKATGRKDDSSQVPVGQS